MKKTLTERKKDIYSDITSKVIKAMEESKATGWKKPWFNMAGNQAPFNAVTGKAYNGVNILNLHLCGYDTNAFAGFKQWKQKGCMVKKGEKGIPVVFFNTVVKEDKETGDKSSFPVFRFLFVWNVHQVSGDFADSVIAANKQDIKLNDNGVNQEVESAIESYLKNELIKTDSGDSAYYSPSADLICMPDKGQFKDKEYYYSTYLHEMAHSTGHKKRLDRKLEETHKREVYAKEELVAELSAAMLCGLYGVNNQPRADHAQYLNSWLKALKSDNSAIVNAASKAQKACDYIADSVSHYEQWKEAGNVITLNK